MPGNPGAQRMPGNPAFPVFGQRISPETLEIYRRDALSRQLAYAAENSRFYARHLRGCTLSLSAADDLRRLPFTVAGDIIAQGKDMVCVSAEQIARIVTLHSTGSSGAPKRIFFSEGDIRRTVEFFSAGMQYLCAAGDTVLIFMPAPSENGVGQLLAEGLTGMGARPVIYGLIGDFADAAEVLRQAKPHTVVGVPAQMRRLALLTPDARPANALLSADYISAAACKTVSRMWGCGIFSHYGLTECGYGGAVECPAHRGMHIRHDELLLEIVEPGGEAPVPEGCWGEIVITTLRREAMPIIRYRTGDMGRLLSGPCGCGSRLPRLDRVRGRLSELRHEINVYEMDELLFGCDAVGDYRALHSAGRLTVALESVIPKGGGAKNGAPEDFAACAAILADKWPEIPVEVVPAENIPAGWTVKRGMQRD